MKIDLDNDHYIGSDSSQFILYKRNIIQSGKNKGEEKPMVIGYYSTVTRALQGYLRQEIRDSDVTTIPELIALINALEDKVDRLARGY